MKMKDIKMRRREIKNTLNKEKQNIFISLDNMIKSIDDRLEELMRLKDVLEKTANENIHTDEDAGMLEIIQFEIESLQDDYNTLTTLELNKIKEIG